MQEETVVIIDDDVGFCKLMSYSLATIKLSTEVYHRSQDYLNNYNPLHACILIDVRIPDINGLMLQKRLISNYNNLIPIIFMSAHADIESVVQAMQHGAHEFLTKPLSENASLDLIQKVIRNDHNRNDRKLLFEFSQRCKYLTKRENEILNEIVDGKMNKVIADDLGISTKTVEIHRANIMKKLQMKSLATLVRFHTLIEDSQRFPDERFNVAVK